jgi:hypothetical protein
VALVPAAWAVASLPKQVARTRWRPSRPQIPQAARSVFLVSGTANFLAFAVLGIFLALVPTYVATLAHSDNLVLGGGAVSIMIGCSVLAQVVAYTRHSPHAHMSGLSLLAVGLIGLAVAGAVSSLPLLLAANAVGGTGYGLVFLGGITDVNAVAPAGRRADILSSFYVIVYLGTGVPVTGTGLLATRTGLLHAVSTSRSPLHSAAWP